MPISCVAICITLKPEGAQASPPQIEPSEMTRQSIGNHWSWWLQCVMAAQRTYLNDRIHTSWFNAERTTSSFVRKGLHTVTMPMQVFKGGMPQGLLEVGCGIAVPPPSAPRTNLNRCLSKRKADICWESMISHCSPISHCHRFWQGAKSLLRLCCHEGLDGKLLLK